jgi:hypothetical protein
MRWSADTPQTATRLATVFLSFREWNHRHAGSHVEQFIAAAYHGNVDAVVPEARDYRLRLNRNRGTTPCPRKRGNSIMLRTVRWRRALAEHERGLSDG